ncbi:MAG: rhodanese-like domain-containing protein [Chloroflexia bacterium]|nr:rhodanese-like domain-containing protein [Chloroflexia bacterium]
MTPEIDTDALPIACSLEAGELAKRGAAIRRELFAAVEERRDLADGYAYRFPGSDELTDKLLAFAAAERTCCAFFRIELAFEPGLGPIWLTLRGPEGIKEFIHQVFAGETRDAEDSNVAAVPKITREELKATLDRGDALVIVEALPEMYYRKTHLPGAINISVEHVDRLAPRLLPDTRAQIVVYCANLPCPSSEMAARRLIELGYTNVREYAEGKQDWLEAGYSTERGRAAQAA